jgi:hypothetical protein
MLLKPAIVIKSNFNWRLLLWRRMPPQKVAGLQMQKLRQKQKQKQSQRPRLLHGWLEKAAAAAKIVILDMVAMFSKNTPHSFKLCTHRVRYVRKYYLRSNRLRALSPRTLAA